MNLKETQCINLFKYLIDIGRFDLIDLLAKSDKLEIHNIKIKRQLVPNLIYHNVIINHLKRNGANIITEE
jgi:hypothetical protein